jgi:hypothetical protein
MLKNISGLLLSGLLLAACGPDECAIAEGTYTVVAGEGHDDCDGRPWDITPGYWTVTIEDGRAFDHNHGCSVPLVKSEDSYWLPAPAPCGDRTMLNVMQFYVEDGKLMVYRERAVEFSFGVCNAFTTFELAEVE